MPLVGYICPSGVPTAGERHDVSFCVGECPHPCVAPPLLLAMYQAEHTNYHQGDYISASMLSGGGCNRKTYFERFEPFYELAGKRYWPFRGTIAHRIIEDATEADEYGWIQEIRCEVELVFPGEPDPIFDKDNNFTGSNREAPRCAPDHCGAPL